MNVQWITQSAFFSRRWWSFILRIVLPAVLAGALFLLAIFLILIPSMERQMMNGKKETIQELVRAAVSIVQEYYDEELAGHLTREQAQAEAATRIELLTWGEDGKDYFWITDMHPTMVIHPYRKDLDGQDLSDFEDLRGKRMFVAFVDAVREQDAGFVDYYWQWKDDPNRIVPKLSYVEAFRPWQWVVGTGIYTEDVREEIARVRQNLVYILLAISALVAILLFYGARQSLKIEKRRAHAEQSLKESNEKYRALVEAATEGTLMILDGKCAYSNKTMVDMLGYEYEALAELELAQLLTVENDADRVAWAHMQALLRGDAAPTQFEARLRGADGSPVDVLLAATPISLVGKDGFILTARSMSGQKAMEAAVEATRRQFRTMSNAISLGVFRSSWGRRGTLLEGNPAMRNILGMSPSADLAGVDWLDCIMDVEERGALVSRLNKNKVLEDFRMGLRQDDGRRAEVSLFAVLVDDENGQPVYCDGIMEDITAQKRGEDEREALIARLQTSLFYLQEPITQAIVPAVTCDMNQPISRAAVLMTKKRTSAIIVTGPDGEPLGIVSDHDFRERLVATAGDTGCAVSRIMTAPVMYISHHALVYEALLRMQEKGIIHLAVTDDAGALMGIIHQRDLIHYQQSSSVIITGSIKQAGSVDDILEAHRRLPGLVKALIDSGAQVRHVNRIISSVSDGIVERLLLMAMDQLGSAPARFAFLTLGSEGREEQTLLTDQDNALLYEDPPPAQQKEVAEYFLALGTLVCDWLDQVGYSYCEGGVMAKNPRWNHPLSVWKDQFAHWIHNANPQELLELNMLFDFRCVSGEQAFARDLRTWVLDEMQAYPPFFLHFAQNALLYKPPLGLLGNIQVSSSGDGPKALSLKEALMPVVNFARLYTLKYRIEATNTLDRLAGLRERGMLSRGSFEQVFPDYEALMRLRLHRQAMAILENRKPSNLISPQEWTPLEEAMLKRLFSATADLRRKIGYDFLGGAT
jgi:PAS domain S-box-containing protein